MCQQVFEEAAVDCGRALGAWSDSRSGKRKGQRVGFPRFKKRTRVVASFRLRNKHPKGRPPAIRIGDNDRPRSVTLPGIGQVAVFDDTRRLRRMLAKDRAKILFATVTHHADRWWVALNVEAARTFKQSCSTRFSLNSPMNWRWLSVGTRKVPSELG